MLGELVDRVAAIKQHALVAVDEGDLGLATRRRGEARIVSEAAGVLIERVDVDHIGPHRALADRQVVPRAVDQDRCLGGARRAEVFCDAHLKAPLRSWEAGPLTNADFLRTVAPLTNAYCTATYIPPVSLAVQHAAMPKS